MRRLSAINLDRRPMDSKNRGETVGNFMIAFRRRRMHLHLDRMVSADFAVVLDASREKGLCAKSEAFMPKAVSPTPRRPGHSQKFVIRKAFSGAKLRELRLWSKAAIFQLRDYLSLSRPSSSAGLSWRTLYQRNERAARRRHNHERIGIRRAAIGSRTTVKSGSTGRKPSKACAGPGSS